MSQAEEPTLHAMAGPLVDQVMTNPILDIAARVWEPERYRAFRVCYRSMRRIDDLVDHRKATGEPLRAAEVTIYRRMLHDWVGVLQRRERAGGFQDELLDTMERFLIPVWPWERLCRAMEYDLTHAGFESFLTFRRYAEGAAVAPAAVFMHLCGIRSENGRYLPPAYDIRWAAQPLAIFSYLVHIMRDFRKDQLSSLNYFPTRLLALEGLTPETIRRMAGTPTDGPCPPALRNLFRRYKRLAGYYGRMARVRLERIEHLLARPYRLSLELIYQLYNQILERVEPDEAAFSPDRVDPPAEVVRARIQETLDRFGGPKDFLPAGKKTGR